MAGRRAAATGGYDPE